MSRQRSSGRELAAIPPSPRVLSGLQDSGRSVGSGSSKRWSPPEGISPDDVARVIAAACRCRAWQVPPGGCQAWHCERDRLLLRCLWATGGRVSEVLALRPVDVERDALVLPNRKNPSQPVKRVFLPSGQADLPGALLLWQRRNQLEERAPLFYGQGRHGRRLSRQEGWAIAKRASARAGVQVLALRASKAGRVGEPAPVHPHVFRHARVRHTLRSTRNLPLVQRQAGWSRLQMAYLSISDQEARELMQGVPE